MNRFLGKLLGSRYTINSTVGKIRNRARFNRIEESHIESGLSLGTRSTIIDATLGRDCTISGNVGFRHSQAGDRLWIDTEVEVNACSLGTEVHIGASCWLYESNVGSFTYFEGGVRIRKASVGNYCSVAPGTVLGLGRHPLDAPGTSPVFYLKDTYFSRSSVDEDSGFEEFPPIEIGSDVWIGQECMVMGGVKIGHGAVIGARAVVTKSVPDFAVVAGVPARIVKYRFPLAVQERLLSLAWWNWGIDELRTRRDELNAILSLERS